MLYAKEYKNVFYINFQVITSLSILSILLAKKILFLKVYSFKSLPINYNNLIKNININIL